MHLRLVEIAPLLCIACSPIGEGKLFYQTGRSLLQAASAFFSTTCGRRHVRRSPEDLIIILLGMHFAVVRSRCSVTSR